MTVKERYDVVIDKRKELEDLQKQLSAESGIDGLVDFHVLLFLQSLLPVRNFQQFLYSSYSVPYALFYYFIRSVANMTPDVESIAPKINFDITEIVRIFVSRIVNLKF